MLASVPIRDTAAQDRPLPGAARRQRRRWLIGLAALLVGGGLVAVLVDRWIATERSVDADRLRIAEVTRGTLVRDAAVTGRVVAAVSPTLYAPMGGTATVLIRAGDPVNRGDVLAQIESPELQSELRREQALLDQLEAQLGSARIDSARQRLAAEREADEAQIALDAALRELEGAERAWQQGAIPEIEYMRAKDAVKSARVRHDNAGAAARLSGQSAGFDVETVQQQHERQRLAVTDLERRIAELEVRAPVDGIVGTLSIADRAVVAANSPLMTLVDLSQLEVALEVPETYADDLGVGMTAEIRIGATTVTGTLSAISPEVVDNRVEARVRFDGEQPDGLRQSQRVSARILIEERPEVILVPRGPFLDAHDGRYAYVVDDGMAIRRAIRVGATSVSSIEILDGLRPGERVVIAGSENFEDVTTVQIND